MAVQVNIINKSQIIPSEWDGGKTYEYFIYPEDAQYSKRNFLFRFSSASILKVPSRFTQFLDYHRFLVMLDQDLAILRNNQSETYLKNEIFRFESNETILSHSLGNDFNLMVSHQVNSANLIIDQQIRMDKSLFIAVFSLQETQLGINSQTFHLNQHSLLVIENKDQEEINIRLSHHAIISTINL